MELVKARGIAEKYMEQLRPHCFRIEIAGSIRREKPEVKDIEIVAIPRPYESIGIFQTGIATVVNQWPKVKGELPCKYTQRLLPEGIKLDLFFANKNNWGLIFAIRTGSAEYSHQILAKGWVAKGCKSIRGHLYYHGHTVQTSEEEDIFKLIGIPWTEPSKREVDE